MSLFRVVKYSSLFYFLKRYRIRLYRAFAVVLFAVLTTLLYGDLVAYLEARNPEGLIYALIGKTVIVYGALAIVLWQFRPLPEPSRAAPPSARKGSSEPSSTPATADGKTDASPLADLADIERHDHLRSRYDDLLQPPPAKARKRGDKGSGQRPAASGQR